MTLPPNIRASRAAPLHHKRLDAGHQQEKDSSPAEPLIIIRLPVIQATQSLLFDSVVGCVSATMDHLTGLMTSYGSGESPLLGDQGQKVGQQVREAYNVGVLPEDDDTEMGIYLSFAKCLFEEVARFSSDLAAKEKRFKAQSEALVNGDRLWLLDEQRQHKLEEEKAAKAELKALERRSSSASASSASSSSRPPPPEQQATKAPSVTSRSSTRPTKLVVREEESPPPPPPPRELLPSRLAAAATPAPPQSPAQQSSKKKVSSPTPPSSPPPPPTTRRTSAPGGSASSSQFKPSLKPVVRKKSRPSKHVKGAKYSKEVTDTLIEWFLKHREQPYPTPKEFAILTKKTGLTVDQARNWLTNVRKRHLKPVLQNKRRPRSFLDYVLLAAFGKKSARSSYSSGGGGGGSSRAGKGKKTLIKKENLPPGSPSVVKYMVKRPQDESDWDGDDSSSEGSDAMDYSPRIRLTWSIEEERRWILPSRTSKARKISYKEDSVDDSSEEEDLVQAKEEVESEDDDRPKSVSKGQKRKRAAASTTASKGKRKVGGGGGGGPATRPSSSKTLKKGKSSTGKKMAAVTSSKVKAHKKKPASGGSSSSKKRRT